MVRTVSGLTLPISCYLSEGINIGSCVYDDLCGLIKSVLDLNETNCPQNLIDNGIPCTCPFNLPIRELNINENFQIPALSNFSNPWLVFFTYLPSGDFDVTIKLTIDNTNISCLNIKFSIKPI